jgi:predicted TIM-barrel enzyme
MQGNRFGRVFPGDTKPIIAMAHLGPLPGTPLYDEIRGVQGIVDDVARDLDVLLRHPFDAVMFCNEGDRPYSLQAGFEGVAVMCRVVTQLAPPDRPFGATSSGTGAPSWTPRPRRPGQGPGAWC